MEAECPMGHTENLSYEELAKRLSNNDFDCREENCSKELSYKVDERFWTLYDGRVTTEKILYRD